MSRYIPKIQEIAAFASMMLPEAQRTELRRRRVTAHHVRGLFEMHHLEYYAWTQNHSWWNLDPQIKAEHRERTKEDIATIAKSKRIRKKEAAHQWKLTEIGFDLSPAPDGRPKGWYKRPQGETRKYQRKIPSRPFPKRHK